MQHNHITWKQLGPGHPEYDGKFFQIQFETMDEAMRGKDMLCWTSKAVLISNVWPCWRRDNDRLEVYLPGRDLSGDKSTLSLNWDDKQTFIDIINVYNRRVDDLNSRRYYKPNFTCNVDMAAPGTDKSTVDVYKLCNYPEDIRRVLQGNAMSAMKLEQDVNILTKLNEQVQQEEHTVMLTYQREKLIEALESAKNKVESHINEFNENTLGRFHVLSAEVFDDKSRSVGEICYYDKPQVLELLSDRYRCIALLKLSTQDSVADNENPVGAYYSTLLNVTTQIAELPKHLLRISKI